MGYSVLNIAEVDGAGPGGAVKFVRRELEVEAFGINWFELPPGAAGIEHTEEKSRQEEVLVVVAGSGHWIADGHELPATVGTFLRFDPDVRRQPIAGPDGLTFVAIGARRGSYEPHGPF